MPFSPLSPETLLRLQREQFAHDRRNHTDVICLCRADRLKHYGLHFAKYVGRLVRANEVQPLNRTIVDAALVALSAANTLGQNLADKFVERAEKGSYVSDIVTDLADCAGRFADACEKIDHLEEFVSIANQANLDVIAWTLAAAQSADLDIEAAIALRRMELRKRAFFVVDA